MGCQGAGFGSSDDLGVGRLTRLPCIPSPRGAAWSRSASGDGLSQGLGRAGWGPLQRSSARAPEVRVVSRRRRGPGETANLAVSEAVVDEREKFAGRGDLGDAGAPPFRQTVAIHLDLGGAPRLG